MFTIFRRHSLLLFATPFIVCATLAVLLSKSDAQFQPPPPGGNGTNNYLTNTVLDINGQKGHLNDTAPLLINGAYGISNQDNGTYIVSSGAPTGINDIVIGATGSQGVVTLSAPGGTTISANATILGTANVAGNLGVTGYITNGDSLIMQAAGGSGSATPLGINFAHFYLSDSASEASILAPSTGILTLDSVVTGDALGTLDCANINLSGHELYSLLPGTGTTFVTNSRTITISTSSSGGSGITNIYVVDLAGTSPSISGGFSNATLTYVITNVYVPLVDTNLVITAVSNQLSQLVTGTVTNWQANFATNHEYDITLGTNIYLTNLQGLTTGFNYGAFRLLNTNASVVYYAYFATGGSLATANAPILAGGLTNGWPITNSQGYFIFNWQCFGTNYLTNATITECNPGL